MPYKINKPNKKIIIGKNPACRNYEILEKYEAGIVLQGDEVRSIRERGISLKNSYCLIEKGEIFLHNCSISSNLRRKERAYKLLLNKHQINRLKSKVSHKGMTIIPILSYFKGNLVKIEIALAYGLTKYDKKRKLKEKELKRELKQIM